MPHSSLWTAQDSALTVGTSQTYFEPVTGLMKLYQTTESALQLPTRTAGKLSRLSVFYSGSPGATTFVNRIATANGSMSVSPGGSGLSADSVNTDSITAGQLINYSWTTPAGAAGAPVGMGMSFAPTSGLTLVLMSSGSNITSGTSIGSNTTNYFEINGENNPPTTTDGKFGCRITQAGTLKNYCANVVVMGSTSAITLAVRKNATTTTAVTVSVTASTTGQYEDTTHTAALSANDSIYVIKSGGQAGSTNGLGSHGCWIDYTSGNKSDLLADSWGSSAGASYGGTTANRFGPVAGAPPNLTSSESSFQFGVGFNATWSNLRWFVNSSTSTQAATVSSRVGGVTKTQTFSVTTATTGSFEDAVNTDSVSQGNLINHLVVGATSISGNIFISEFSGVLNDTSASIFNDSVSEALSLSETNSATAIFLASTSEALSLTETNHADLNDIVSDSDALGLTATQSCVAIFNVSVSESLGLSDTSAGTKLAEDSHYAVIIWHSQIG